MTWTLEEALNYYRSQGAPGNQNALIQLLKEIQQESGGALPTGAVASAARYYGVKESLLLALVRRVPSLRLENRHHLSLCGGDSCAKAAGLAAFVLKTYGARPEAFTWDCVGCMRQCNKGPNLKWDGQLYHGADEALIRRLAESAGKTT